MKSKKRFVSGIIPLAAALIVLLPACQSQEPDPFAALDDEAEMEESMEASAVQPLQMAEGQLVAVDPDEATLTIMTPRGSREEFRYDSWTEVIGADQTVEGLNAQNGTVLRIHYMEEALGRIALRIEVSPSGEES